MRKEGGKKSKRKGEDLKVVVGDDISVCTQAKMTSKLVLRTTQRAAMQSPMNKGA